MCFLVDFRERIFQSGWKVKICLSHDIHLFFFLYCIQLPVSYESYEALFTEILFLTQIILQTDRQEQVCNSLPLPFSVYRSIPFERGRSGASSSGASSISALSFWSMFSRIFSSFNRAVFSASLLLWQRVQPAQCGLFDTMQIAEKNREMISGITGNMHDGYDIIFKDGHSCHCRTKKDVRSCIIEYCNEKGDWFVLFYCKMCLT